MSPKSKKPLGRYRPEAEWELNRSIFTHGATAAGSIFYKGLDAVTGSRRFLLRHHWTVDGETRRANKVIVAANASEAERELGSWIHTIRTGRMLPRRDLTLTAYVEDIWFPGRVGRIAGSTMQNERRFWASRIKPAIGDNRLEELVGVVPEWLTRNSSGWTVELPPRRNSRDGSKRIVHLKGGSKASKSAKDLLRNILNDLVDGGYLSESPMPKPPRRKSRKEKLLSKPSPTAHRKYWTRDETEEFWAKGERFASGMDEVCYPKVRYSRRGKRACTERMGPYQAALSFLYGAFGLAFGTRPGEGCASRWDDLVRTDDGWVLRVGASIGIPDADRLLNADCPKWDRTPTKTGELGVVSDLSGFVDRYLLPFKQYQARLEAVGELTNPDGFIFPRPEGGYYNPDRMREKLRDFCAGIGMSRRISPYGLRHTHATLLLEAGVSLSAISRRLRHASVLITAQVYAHVTARLEAQTSLRVTQSGLVPPESNTGGSDATQGERGVVDFDMWVRRRRGTGTGKA